MTSDRYVARQKWLRMGVASLVAASAMFCVVGCAPPEEKTPSSVKAAEPMSDKDPSPEEIMDWIKNVDRANMSAENRKLLEEAEKEIETGLKQVRSGVRRGNAVFENDRRKSASQPKK